MGRVVSKISQFYNILVLQSNRWRKAWRDGGQGVAESWISDFQLFFLKIFLNSLLKETEIVLLVENKNNGPRQWPSVAAKIFRWKTDGTLYKAWNHHLSLISQKEPTRHQVPPKCDAGESTLYMKHPCPKH